MMEKCNYRKDPHQDIDHVFRDLLPAHGMVERPAQVELSHQMLDTMLNGSIALCDAGTGIGKTYAYLVAGVVFRRYRSRAGLPNQPLLISTSSIALQGAIIHDYLPFLSKVMMADGMLDSPLRAVLRKGKSHYVCDARLMKRLQMAGNRPIAVISADMTVNGSVFLQRVTAARLNAAISAIWMCVPQRDMPSRFVITTSFWPTPFTKGVGNAPFCRIAAPS